MFKEFFAPCLRITKQRQWWNLHEMENKAGFRLRCVGDSEPSAFMKAGKLLVGYC
jgi:hypothetical protein